MKTNNLLDKSGEYNFLFLACTIAAICKDSPLTIKMGDILRFWEGDIKLLQYDLFVDTNNKKGTITFSLKEKKNEN